MEWQLRASTAASHGVEFVSHRHGEQAGCQGEEKSKLPSVIAHLEFWVTELKWTDTWPFEKVLFFSFHLPCKLLFLPLCHVIPGTGLKCDDCHTLITNCLEHLQHAYITLYCKLNCDAEQSTCKIHWYKITWTKWRYFWSLGLPSLWWPCMHNKWLYRPLDHPIIPCCWSCGLTTHSATWLLITHMQPIPRQTSKHGICSQ